MRHGFDDSFRAHGHKNGLLWTDGWDGYPAERSELCGFIRRSGIANVVSLTGDRHAHMAGVVYDDFDANTATAVLPEFAGAAVSAASRMIIQRELSAHDKDVAGLVTFAGREKGYKQAIMPTLNAWMLYGAAAAGAIQDGEPEDSAKNLADGDVNPHLRYIDSDAHGYFVARFDKEACEVEFVSVFEPVRRRISFRVLPWSESESPRVELLRVDGEPPLAGLRS